MSSLPAQTQRLCSSFIPRKRFPPGPPTPSWYLGHMVKALRELKQRRILSDVDIFVEVRNARLPLTSRNPVFDNFLKDSTLDPKRLIVYSHSDLGDPSLENVIVDAHRDFTKDQTAIFVNSKKPKHVERLLDTIKDLLKDAKPHFLPGHSENLNSRLKKEKVQKLVQDQDRRLGFNILVSGMPNVGKSTLINSLRERGVGGKKSLRVGPQAGITRNIMGVIKILEEPLVYVYDTPGIMVPYLGQGITSWERCLKLSLTKGIKEDIVDSVVAADYLLYKLNLYLFANEKKRPIPDCLSKYVDAGKYPTNDINELLEEIGKRSGALLKGGSVDYHRASKFFISMFEKGKLGNICLDNLGENSEQRRENMKRFLTYDPENSDNKNIKTILQNEQQQQQQENVDNNNHDQDTLPLDDVTQLLNAGQVQSRSQLKAQKKQRILKRIASKNPANKRNS